MADRFLEPERTYLARQLASKLADAQALVIRLREADPDGRGTYDSRHAETRIENVMDSVCDNYGVEP